MESTRNQVGDPSVIPIKPGPDPSITHGTKERLDAQNISNPAGDVINTAKVKSVIGGLVNDVAGRLGRTRLPNRLLLSFC